MYLSKFIEKDVSGHVAKLVEAPVFELYSQRENGCAALAILGVNTHINFIVC